MVTTSQEDGNVPDINDSDGDDSESSDELWDQPLETAGLLCFWFQSLF